MTNVLNFIRLALTHVNLDTVPNGTVLAGGTATNVGAEPWHYPYGTMWAKLLRHALRSGGKITIAPTAGRKFPIYT